MTKIKKIQIFNKQMIQITNEDNMAINGTLS
jgi:hypothetical protein